MAIKKLQNNYTTPEQSKRLLELGVPADSADMLWDGCVDAKDGWVFEDFPIYTDKPFSYYQLLYRQEDIVHILPCWSVGRLIEIMLNSQIDTGTYSLGFMLDKDTFSIESLIDIIDEDIREFDFLKLEE